MTQHVEELIGGYTLGSLSAEENRVVEEHVASCSQCSEELLQTQELLGLLPLSLEELSPPAAMKARILEAVEAERAAMKSRPESLERKSLPPRRSVPIHQMRSWAPLLAAAAVVLFVGGLVLGRATQSTHLSAQQRYQQLVGNATSRGATVKPLASAGRFRAEAAIAVVKSGRASLILGPTARPRHGQIYQLWFLTAGSPPKSVGVFSMSPSQAGVLHLPVRLRGYRQAAVTQEPAPHGSRQPTTKPFMVANVQSVATASG